MGGALLADPERHGRAVELKEAARAAGVEVLVPAFAIGLFEYGFVPVAHGNELVKIRAERVVVASGIVEQPAPLPGNDLVGVMLADGCAGSSTGSRSSRRACFVVTADDSGLAAAADLERAGVDVAGAVDLRVDQPPNIEARGHKGRVEAVSSTASHPLRPRRDVRSPQPNYKLLAQAGARVEYDDTRGVFVPTDLPPGVSAVGGAAGDVGVPAVSAPVLGYHRREDVRLLLRGQTTKDLKYAIGEGFDSIELSKRYTNVTMGPCQGRLCHVSSIRVYAKATGLDENANRDDDRAPAAPRPSRSGCSPAIHRSRQAHIAPSRPEDAVLG